MSLTQVKYTYFLLTCGATRLVMVEQSLQLWSKCCVFGSKLGTLPEFIALFLRLVITF
jgi:hypothetical protein